jgi:hypothetical protein
MVYRIIKKFKFTNHGFPGVINIDKEGFIPFLSPNIVIISSLNLIDRKSQ